MESHPHHSTSIDRAPASNSFSPVVESDPVMRVLEKIADKYYPRMIEIARESDDRQPEAFNEKGEAFVRGAQLLAEAAIRAAQAAAVRSV